MVHAEMRSNWGYAKLGGETRSHAIEEMRHAERLIERLLYLDAVPDVGFGLNPKIGGSVREQIDVDHAAEAEAIGQYNNAVRICEQAGDNGSRSLFESLLKDEEEHADMLEAQQHQIRELGYEQYLTQQMNGGEEH
jgi:bacterioferritin